MDTSQLATAAFTFLLPHLDYIRGKVADSMLAESGKSLVTAFKDKWLAKSPAAQESIEDLAADPASADNRDAVLVQLRKAITKDPELAAEMERLLPQVGIEVNVSGIGNKTVANQGHHNTIVIS